MYAWKGVRIPEHLIEKRMEMTTAQIRKETNQEIKRIMIEIYTSLHGPHSVIKDMKAKKIGEDKNHGFPRVIYEVDSMRFIHVVNGSLEPDGSRREFFLGVQSNETDPHSAIATSYGRPANKYKEAVRT